MNILEETIEFSAPVLVALIAWGFAELGRLIRSRVPEGKTRRAILRLNEVLFTRVQQTNQLFVDRAKAAAKDGKLTYGEAADAFQTVRQAVLKDLGRSGVRALRYVVAPEEIESYIKAKIDAAVRDASSLSEVRRVA